MKSIRIFLSKLIDGRTDEVSSRRGVALTALGLVILMALVHAAGRDINADIYISTIGLVAAALGFTLYGRKNEKD